MATDEASRWATDEANKGDTKMATDEANRWAKPTKIHTLLSERSFKSIHLSLMPVGIDFGKLWIHREAHQDPSNHMYIKYAFLVHAGLPAPMTCTDQTHS